MPFQKGQSGNPKGRTNGKLFGEALRIRLLEADGLELHKIAEKLIAKANEGDLMAIKEIADRVDGRPAQIIAGDADNPLALIGTIEIIAGKADK